MQPELNAYLVDTVEALADLEAYASDAEFISLDVETDNRQEKKARLYGIGVSFDDTSGFYIPIRAKDGSMVWDEQTTKDIYSLIYDLCSKKKLIGWNLIYDTLVFEYNTGYDLSPLIYTDGILLKHAVDEERPFGLKETAVKYLGQWADKAQLALKDNIKANGGSVTKDQFDMYKADTSVLAEYCCWDVLLTYRLCMLFDKQLREEGLDKLFYEEETMPLYREVTIGMKRQGFPIDVEYFQTLNRDILRDIDTLESEIIEDLYKDAEVQDHVKHLLDEEYPVKRTGSFPKVFAEYLGISLADESGKVSLAKKVIQKKAEESDHPYFKWLLGDDDVISKLTLDNVQMFWFSKDNPDRKFVFNLKSNDHLGWLFFESLGLQPLSKTEGGKPQCDEDFLESIKKDFDFVKKLLDMKKLIKLQSTYIEGLLYEQIEGVIYTSMLQFGTTSGRYSSKNPNCQNIPRLKDEEANLTPLVLKYTNAIKKGFVAPKGYKLVNADYSSLEPVCFAHVSGDEGLRKVFRDGLDLYSSIAIDTWGITDSSADKKAPNYLKKTHPELRQKAKIFTLAVPYGAEAGRISQLMETEYEDAAFTIESYLDAYPELRAYMKRQNYLATRKGKIVTQYGRVRHLPKAKEIYDRYGDRILTDKKWVKEHGLGETKYILKNALNNAKNFPIQGLAAHIVNRAMINVAREFKRLGLDAKIILQVHDEITCIAREDQAERAAEVLQECMENVVTLSVPLAAEPLIADNWAEAK